MKNIEVLFFLSTPADDHKSVYMLRMWTLEIIPDINRLMNLGLNKLQQGFSALRVN